MVSCQCIGLVLGLVLGVNVLSVARREHGEQLVLHRDAKRFCSAASGLLQNPKHYEKLDIESEKVLNQQCKLGAESEAKANPLRSPCNHECLDDSAATEASQVDVRHVDATIARPILNELADRLEMGCTMDEDDKESLFILVHWAEVTMNYALSMELGSLIHHREVFDMLHREDSATSYLEEVAERVKRIHDKGWLHYQTLVSLTHVSALARDDRSVVTSGVEIVRELMASPCRELMGERCIPGHMRVKHIYDGDGALRALVVVYFEMERTTDKGGKSCSDLSLCLNQTDKELSTFDVMSETPLPPSHRWAADSAMIVFPTAPSWLAWWHTFAFPRQQPLNHCKRGDCGRGNAVLSDELDALWDGADGIESALADLDDKHDYLRCKADRPFDEQSLMYVMGHSTGGGLATLAALRLLGSGLVPRGNLRLLTLSSPMVLDETAARTFRAQHVGGISVWAGENDWALGWPGGNWHFVDEPHLLREHPCPEEDMDFWGRLQDFMFTNADTTISWRAHVDPAPPNIACVIAAVRLRAAQSASLGASTADSLCWQRFRDHLASFTIWVPWELFFERSGVAAVLVYLCQNTDTLAWLYEQARVITPMILNPHDGYMPYGLLLLLVMYFVQAQCSGTICQAQP